MPSSPTSSRNPGAEHFRTGTRKGRPTKVRGMSLRSLTLIQEMKSIARAVQPITGRGIGYKLFTKGLIPSMARPDMAAVYRLLLVAREQGIVPWPWVVDEGRELERTPTWADPDEYANVVAQSYRRDFWTQQPVRAEVWSEKGTIRGVLSPVLDEFAVGFRVLHGFSGATAIHNIAEARDGRPLIILYVGDLDPSGAYMSAIDLPARLAEYGASHVTLRRIALTQQQVPDLPSFASDTKAKDPRYPWFVRNYGLRCWEIDAMDPNDLRDCVKREIKKLIEPIAWRRCVVVNKAEQESLRSILSQWPR